MSIDYDALLRTFQAQSEEGLRAAEDGLLRLESRPDDAEALGEVFRAVHTLKGDSASLGFAALADLAHDAEDVLDELRDGTREVTSPTVTLLLQALDGLRDGLSAATSGEDDASPAHQELLRQLREMAPVSQEPAAVADKGGTVRSAVTSGPGRGPVNRTLRVDVEKLDDLLTLTGEIAVGRGRLTQVLEDESTTRELLIEMHREADRTHLDLQELVMALRMVPIGPTFRQFARVVRDQSEMLGKQARLATEGVDVEVDNSVLQLLKDPLTHMVRNALDHGIEPPDVRAARGKPRCGQMVLRAAHESGNVVIELSDDGAGLDHAQILARARERDLVHAGQALGEAEVAALIFEAGFSTAERVSDLSGRGVGMDVVRHNVEALRGSIAVASRPGRGTTFTIRLPLTLAIIEGLLVGLGDETYVVPLDAVQESVELPPGAATAGEAHGVMIVRGRTLPFVRLRHLFDLPGDPPARENVVIVRGDTGQAGLVVDTLHGQSQTVIKPLTKLFQRVAGVSASAILGNGRVALILDVPGLLRREVEHTSKSVRSEAEVGVS